MDGSKLTQISHNKWTTTNQVHYSYGWLGVRYQATTNLVLTEGEIFLYDGNGFVSDFETAENCTTQDGKCNTNTSIVLWNVQQMTKKCLYSEVGFFDAQIYENHVIIDELQTSFVFSKENKTFRSENCNFTNPSLMNGDIVINIVTKIANARSRRNTNLALASAVGKLMMMETYQEDNNDPENTKFQYLFDSLQQEFQQQLKLVEQRTCENRNNLLLLIEWLSLDNPTLAANLLLQRNDVIAKRIDEKLLTAPCESDLLNSKIIEFRGGLISKFEIDKINAAL
ncbi:hypothetical protein WUBG_16578 [Wuchereria bancrofti]|uniref:Uncharacterized protein n=1 Tax=Wuchereria bancrofti TaxID=6293 RepID=J9AEQ8_WUCBA|nr:hypothetical protein WUBG_16578 [Wuchereria bancrofti]